MTERLYPDEWERTPRPKHIKAGRKWYIAYMRPQNAKAWTLIELNSSTLAHAENEAIIRAEHKFAPGPVDIEIQRVVHQPVRFLQHCISKKVPSA